MAKKFKKEIYKDLLDNLHNKEGLTIRQIAKKFKTYPAAIFRAMIHHKISIKNKSEAQKLALKEGRAKHPTEGTIRPEKTRDKIGDTLYKNWKANPQRKDEAIERGKKIWASFSDEKVKEIREKSCKVLKEMTEKGSKIETSLFTYLVGKGLNVEMHKKHLVSAEKLEIDILLPSDGICIEIDGPQHFFPIYGEKDFQKRKARDAKKNGLLLHDGYAIIRVAVLVRHISKAKMRAFCRSIYEKIVKLKIDFPDNKKERFITMDFEDIINEKREAN